MFLLVSGRHVGAHLGGHQHGVSIQISINLGKTFLRISSIRKIAATWILARVFAYLPSFYFQILDLIYWTVYFDLFGITWHWKPANALYSNLSKRRRRSCDGKRTTSRRETRRLLCAGGRCKFYLEHYVKNHEEYIRRTARAVKLVEQVECNC